MKTSNRLSAHVARTMCGLAVLAASANASRAQSTWDGGGGDNNWSTAGNWNDNQVPTFPADLVFDGGTRLTPNNNLTNPAVRNVDFGAAAGAFVIGGNPFTLGDSATADYRDGGVNQADDSLQTINNDITLSRGQHEIATTGAGGLTFNGAITRNAGATARFAPAAGTSIKTTLTNTNGLLGGWATIRNPSPSSTENTFLFAKVDGSGNVVPYLDYTANDTIDGLGPTPESEFPVGMNASSNIRWLGTAIQPGQLIAPFGVSDLNTFLYDQDTSFGAPNLAAAYQEVFVGDGNTLRFTSGGGIFRSNPVGAQESESLRFTGGNVTAGNSNAPAELYIWTSTTQDPLEAGQGEHHNDTINFQTTNITDNADGGAVAVIKSGPGAVRSNSAGHSFSGGLYLNRGVWRAQANMSTAFGVGPVYVASGAQGYVNADGTVPNDFYVSGTGIDEGAFHVGALRIAADGAVMDGNIILTADARIGNRGAQASNAELGMPAVQGVVFNGKITGNFNLEMGVGGGQGGAGLDSNMPTMIMVNPANDWGGNTTFGRGRIRVGGTGEVIPHGPEKGDVTILGEAGSESILTLDSQVETVNGLFSSGDANLAVVTNSTAGAATLRVGANNASSAYAGQIVDHTGTIGVTKIGAGTLTLTGTLLYSGDTRVYGGTLSINSASLSILGDVHVTAGAVLNLDFAGSNFIDSLFFDGIAQPTGTYGRVGSSATFQSNRFSGDGILEVFTLGTSLIPGDFDGDVDVDLDDLTRWKSSYGDGGFADADYDGDSDGNDLMIWQQNLGRTTPPAIAAGGAVPEPGALVLASCAVTGLGAARRRRQ